MGRSEELTSFRGEHIVECYVDKTTNRKISGLS
ncbi:hypothetical protein [Paenibacillus kribbensis]